MYTILVDGQTLYAPALSDEYANVLTPSLSLEVNRAGSLSFVLPPGHPMKDSMQRMKSMVTVEQDGKEIFRGRVLEETTDLYNQTEYYCEGELTFLMDSVQRPYTYTGTVEDYFTQLIRRHNEQVDADKQFLVGEVTVSTDGELTYENNGYSDTYSEIEGMLLGTYGGYLRTRLVAGVRYIDYVASLNQSTGQKIEFAVNLLDIEKQLDAQEIYTVLIPIGSSVGSGPPATIAEVNNGLDYLEDAEGIAKHGRICKVVAFDGVTDPAKLLELGRAELAKAGTVENLTLTAADLHLFDVNTDTIHLGDTVQLVSAPHGLDKEAVCTGIDLDLENLENTKYYFGQEQESMAGNAATMAGLIRQNTKIIKETWKHYSETDYTVSIHTGLLDSHDKYLSQARIDIDGINAQLKLKAEKQVTDELTGALKTLETDFTVGYDGLRGIIQENDKTVSELKSTIDGLEHWVTDSEGNVSELTNTVRGLESKMETADGKVSQLTNTADGLTSTIIGQGNDFATFYTRVDEIKAAVVDTQGNVGYLSVKADGVTAKVIGVENRVSQLAVTADGLEYTLTKQGQELSSLKALIDEISLTVKDTKGAMGQLIVKSDSITGKVISADEKMSSKFEMLAGIINLETKADGTVVSVRLDAAENSIRLKADKTYVEKLIADEISATNAKISNITSGLTVASVLSANLVDGTQGHFTYLHGDAINLGDNNLVCYTMEFAGRSGKYFGTGGGLNLAHSHAVTVNDDGTITLGEVSAEGGNFKIADTKAYKDGVSAAKASVKLTAPDGWQNGRYVVKASNGESLPVELPSFSASGGTTFDSDHKTKVYFYTPSVTGPLREAEVDASGVYKNGWNECRAAMTRINDLYTISRTAPSGGLYTLVDGKYTSVGTDWVQVTSYSSAYRRPAEIA